MRHYTMRYDAIQDRAMRMGLKRRRKWRTEVDEGGALVAPCDSGQSGYGCGKKHGFL